MTRPLLVLTLVAACGCEQPAAPSSPNAPIHVRAVRPQRNRANVAAVTVRFAHSGLEPGKVAQGYDRLQVAAVFADSDRRDVHLVRDLVVQGRRGPRLPAADACIRQAGPLDPATHTGIAPSAHMQLLDVGNVLLASGQRRLPLRIAMVPSLFSAVRGVRYDGQIDNAREWLAAKTLGLQATGGDGVGRFEATVNVPRPVRLTRVGGKPVRGGHVVVDDDPSGLEIRWGSVDGSAGLEVVLGVERGQSLDWIRCRLVDDGHFTIPAGVLTDLPKRSVRRPWLISLVRWQTAPIPGFTGTPLRLELVDRVRIR